MRSSSTLSFLKLEKRSFEILPPGTFGSLGLKSPVAFNKSPTQLKEKMKIATVDPKSPLALAVEATLKGAGVEVEFVDHKAENDFDVRFESQGMNSDFPEIEFYLSALSSWAFLPVSTPEKEIILRSLHSGSRQERSELMQNFGESLLKDGRVIPILVRSYAHLYKESRLGHGIITTYDGEIPFWKMQVSD